MLSSHGVFGLADYFNHTTGHGFAKILPRHSLTLSPSLAPQEFKFKILLLTFKCLDGEAPAYLIKLITARSQLRYSLEIK